MKDIKYEYIKFPTSDCEYYTFDGTPIFRKEDSFYMGGDEISISNIPFDAPDFFKKNNTLTAPVTAEYGSYNYGGSDNEFEEDELKQASEMLEEVTEDSDTEDSDNTESDTEEDNTQTETVDKKPFKGIRLHGFLRYYDNVKDGDKYKETCKEIDRVCKKAKADLKKKSIGKHLKGIDLDGLTDEDIQKLTEVFDKNK